MSTRRREPKRKIKMKIMRRWTLICLASLIIRGSQLFCVVSEHLDRESTAADVSIAAATDIVFSRPEEASAPVPGSSVTPTILQKSVRPRKLRKGRNARNQSLLERWQFFHSQTSRQVFAEEDSEDEVDDEVLDLEYRMRLDRFKDVSQHEKQLMLLWNSFMRKQRVVVDGEDQVTWLLFNT
ncbi:putative polycomb protein, VEFS-Box [Helianthus annuus]|nr:putative polycomb protein, VEFS-Box [Helianthus annuus]